MFWRVSLVAALITTGLFLFVVAGFSDGHSAQFNYNWAVHYIDTFGWDALLPRHLPGLWAGLGGYDFFFYGPLPFWFIAAFVSPTCFGCTPETEFILGAAVFWLLSGFTFYLFIRRYFDTRHAIFGALVYVVLPYHLWIDWFIRQAVGEFAAYAFLPLIALGFDAIRLNERHGWTLSIGVAGVALSHLPTALLAGHVFGVTALLIFGQMVRKKENALGFLMPIVGWTVLGGLLSSFYWLPAVALLDKVSPNALYTSYFVAERWLFGLRFDQPDQSFARIILFSFLAVFPFIALSAALSRGAIQMWLLVPVALSLFLNSEASEFVWKHWIINRVQFPWRLMVFVDFSAAIAITFAVMKFDLFYKIRVLSVLVLSVLVLLAIVPIAKVGASAIGWAFSEYNSSTDWAGAAEYLSPEMLAATRSRSGVDDDYALNQKEISFGIQEISNELAETPVLFASLESSPRRATILPLQDVPRLSVPLQYWFLWRAELEGGAPLELSANPRLGTIDIIAPHDGFQGRTVILTLPYHYSERLGFAVSFLSLLLFGVVIFNSLWLKPTFRE